MNELKIAVFAPHLHFSPTASAEMFITKNQMKGLVRLGNEVILLTESNIYTEPIKVNEGYTIYPIARKISSSCFPLTPHTIIKAAKILNEKTYVDVIYTVGSPFSGLWSAMLGHMTHIPTVHYVNKPIESYKEMGVFNWWRGTKFDRMVEDFEVPFRYLTRYLLNLPLFELFMLPSLAKWGLKHVTRVITSSEYVKWSLFHYGFDVKNVCVVYPGIEVPELTANGDASTISYYGHFRSGRGVLDLVRAFSKVVGEYSDAKLVIAASEVDELTRHHFERLIQRYDLSSNITWKGVVNNVYLDILAPSTIIALPHRDGPSLKLYEAMATAKPVVATRVWSTSELVIDGVTGCLVNPGDVEELANKLSFLLSNPELAKEIGMRARITVREKCGLDKTSKEILSVLKEARHEEKK